MTIRQIISTSAVLLALAVPAIAQDARRSRAEAAAARAGSAELQNDEELKLLALRSVLQTDPDKGVPLIEKMLAGDASPRVRDRALSVLSQIQSPRAREVVINTAKNNANPDAQRTAIRYLGMLNEPGTRERANEALVSIYKSDSSGSDIRRAVVTALFIQPNARALVDLARTEKDPSLKKEIVSKLSVMKAPEANDYMLELLK